MKPYLDLLRLLRDKLVTRGATANRTAIKATKIAGYTMRFDLTGGKVPVVTTKYVHLKSVIVELIMFLRGITNAQFLLDHNVHIWDEWMIPEDETQRREKSHRDLQQEYQESTGLTASQAEEALNRAYYQHGDSSKTAEAREAMFKAAGIETHTDMVLQHKGDLGPIYGAQWRRFPAGDFFNSLTADELHQYVESMAPDQQAIFDARTGYEAGEAFDIRKAREVLSEIGIDQIAQAIFLLEHRPNSRRIIVTAWNPQVVPSDDLSPQDNVRRGRAALASCHCLVQFVTEELSLDERIALIRADWERVHVGKGPIHLVADESNIDRFRQSNGNTYPKHRINCLMYQRSCDAYLGVPFNITSYAILTHMVAQVVNMTPGEFVWMGGDVHLYANALAQTEIQLTREPKEGPTISLNPEVACIFDFKPDDIKIEGYKHHGSLKVDVAV